MNNLTDILLQGESLKIEFKQSFSDEVIISLVAFSNTKGGAVYLGISDKKEIKGVELGKETVADWINEIKNKTQPAIVPNVDVLDVNGKTLVAFSVAEYPIKPLCIKGRYYKRERNSNHLMTAIEIADANLQSRQVSWDSYPYTGAKFEDLNIEKIKQFIRKVNEVGRFVLSENPKEALDKLGLFQDDTPTNAAMVLFSKRDLHYNVHIGRFKTPTMIIADKIISGNLYDVAEEAMQTIIGHLKFAFEIDIKDANTQRTEIPEYPLEAVRELLMNALVHRDYQSSTDVQIKIFDNTISFFNPSGLYGDITEDDLKTDTYRSSTRNKQIAESFYLTKDIEKYGSGFVRIRKAIADYSTMRFDYRNASYGFFAEFSYTEQKQRIQKGSEKGSEILFLISENPQITISELGKKANLSTRMIEKYLAQFSTDGLLKRIGGRKQGYWQVNKKSNEQSH